MEKGKDKVKKICEVLRKETLDPAREEAAMIIEAAHVDAGKILIEARREREKILAEAMAEIERQRVIFQSSLAQACRQSLETLKQSIEEKLFNQELLQTLLGPLKDPNVLAKLIQAVVEAVEKEGIETDLSAYISASVPARAVNELLARSVLDKLKEKSVLLGPMAGGIAVKLHGQKITLDLSEAALKELVANYIRKDFRSLLLGSI